MKLTWIYLIRDNRSGYYKIGKSDEPQKRLADLRRQSTKEPFPNDYELIEAWWARESVETEMHNKFGHRRIRGEWFHLADKDINDLHLALLPRQRFSIEIETESKEERMRTDKIAELENALAIAIREGNSWRLLHEATKEKLSMAVASTENGRIHKSLPRYLKALPLSRKAAAEYLGVCLMTIDRALAKGSLKDGGIDHYRVGRRVLFDIERHLDPFLIATEQK